MNLKDVKIIHKGGDIPWKDGKVWQFYTQKLTYNLFHNEALEILETLDNREFSRIASYMYVRKSCVHSIEDSFLYSLKVKDEEDPRFSASMCYILRDVEGIEREDLERIAFMLDVPLIRD